MGIHDRDWYRKTPTPPPLMRRVSALSMTKILLITNIACFVLQQLAAGSGWEPVHGGLGMKPDDVIGRFHVWQIFTSMFLHGSLLHLAFNMLVLWMFGQHVERRLGRWSFLRFYLLAGLTAGLAYVVFGFFRQRFSPAIGASGAIMGILVYFTMLNPNAVVHFMLILPMKMKYATLLIVGIDIYYFVVNPASHGVANSAHLGGALYGYLAYRYGHRVDRFFTHLELKNEIRSERKSSDELDRLEAEMDALLEKVGRDGIDGLSEEERERLTRVSKRLREERP